jgi:HK97 gp10 family phage protein
MITMQIKGLPQLQRTAARLPGVAQEHAQATVASAVRAVEARARSLVRRDTGALQGAIHGRVEGLRGGVGIAGGMINGRRPATYWRHVEFGTVRVPARPFLRPAAEAEVPVVEQRARDLGQQLERAWGT